MRWLEGAVAGVGDVYAAGLAGGDELDGGGLGDGVAFVADDVDVGSAVIDEGHVAGVDVGLAGGIGTIVLGDGAGGDDDETVAGVGVPAGGSSGLPDVALDVEG